ncbi:MAG: glycosyl hydrolase [Clostridiales bacterium]|nr:glycosyl hydrolase [Clostridiales bacterium]
MGIIMRERARELVKQMTLEEKASLCSGKNFWEMKGVERLGVEEIMVTDGPHGLRKQSGDADHLGLNGSVPATCFPLACLTANSWNKKAIYAMGKAMGEECVQEGVSVILGPGINIKRSPLCGRNFEYFSEDPLLAGECGTALVNGVQSQGIGTSLKHYAANSQEKARLTSNSIIDERALREIYLSAFEMVVKEAKPWTLMCSYNKINGEYGCQNTYTLDKCLRKEWGFEGIVMTDWGAMDRRTDALKAGLELEMPGPADYNDNEIVEAVKTGELAEAVLDDRATKIVEMILMAQNTPKGSKYDIESHHKLARKVAVDSMVLLKNEDNILPLKKDKTYAVIGAFAKTPRYQGAGSSKINPHRIDNSLEAFDEAGISYEYAEGFVLGKAGVDRDIIEEACVCAKGKDGVIVYAGLPDEYESEGFDRSNMNMPESHVALIDAIAEVNPNLIVVLMCGSPVLMQWHDKAKGILLAYLGGEVAGSACVDVLTGAVNPSGKLAETYPLSLEDTPAYHHFANDEENIEYRESIFVGYRYYDWANKKVLYPFGYGMSYTNFTYNSMDVIWDDVKKNGLVRVKVSNTGALKGKEIIQLYIGMKDSNIMRAPKELKGFVKVELEPSQSQIVEIPLNDRSFSFYDVSKGDWNIEEGTYQLYVAASSRDIRLTEEIKVSGEAVKKAWKYTPDDVIYKGILDISREQFEKIYGGPLPIEAENTEINMNSKFGDVIKLEAGKTIFKPMLEQAEEMMAKDDDISRMVLAMMNDLPLRSLTMFAGGSLNKGQIQEIIDQINAIR